MNKTLIHSPSPITAVVVCCAVWVATFIVPAFYAPLPPIAFITVGLWVHEIRKETTKVIRVLAMAAVFFGLLTGASTLGGVVFDEAFRMSIKSFATISALSACIIFTAAATRPLHWLRLFDKVGLPRELSYVMLTSVTSLPLMTEYGSRVVGLLRVKRVDVSSLIGRFKAYLRIIAPLFAVLLRDLRIHARSQSFRSFFSDARIVLPSLGNEFKLNIEWLLICFLILATSAIANYLKW